jgi:hypothetical protein
VSDVETLVHQHTSTTHQSNSNVEITHTNKRTHPHTLIISLGERRVLVNTSFPRCSQNLDRRHWCLYVQVATECNGATSSCHFEVIGRVYSSLVFRYNNRTRLKRRRVLPIFMWRILSKAETQRSPIFMARNYFHATLKNF